MKRQYWSYYASEDKTKMAFCMPYESDWDRSYKIVIRTRTGKKCSVSLLVKRRFSNRDLAQDRLESIAEAKGWKKAFV